MGNSITAGEELRKYFYESGLNFLSSMPQRRIQEMILAMAQKGHSGKMVDCGELGAGHRTTYGHFLSKPIGNNPVISQKISLQNTFLEAGLTHSGILLPAAQDFEQQFLHLLCPDLVFFFLCVYQFPQNMRIAQAVSGCFIAVVWLPEVMYHGVRKGFDFLPTMVYTTLITINEQIPKNAQNHPVTVKRHLERELPVIHNF